jgi:AraC-like DNA-binding protein
MYKLGAVKTTDIAKLKTEIEQKTTFSLNRCELNIFETHKKAEKVKLHFGGFAITSMLRGKKVIHNDNQAFNYVPGETLMVPSAAEMVIDFPEAAYTRPSQCTALVIEDAYLLKQLEYINELYPRDTELNKTWSIDPQGLFLQNDEKIATLSTSLVKLFSGNDPMKDLLVDLKLKELVLSIMRLQNYSGIDRPVSEGRGYTNERFKAVVEHIRKNIRTNINAIELSKMAYMSKSVFYRTFTNEFGVPPARLVLKEKIKHAKALIANDYYSMSEICYEAGFSDPNYFSRVFKKLEGMTPSEYKQRVTQQ